jgi:hypothetical protein
METKRAMPELNPFTPFYTVMVATFEPPSAAIEYAPPSDWFEQPDGSVAGRAVRNVAVMPIEHYEALRDLAATLSAEVDAWRAWGPQPDEVFTGMDRKPWFAVTDARAATDAARKERT